MKSQVSHPRRQWHGVLRSMLLAVACASGLLSPADGRAQGLQAHDANMTSQHGTIQGQLAAIATQLGQLDSIQLQLTQLEAIAAKVADLYVPFKVEVAGGLCDSGPAPSSNPEIVIDSDGTDTFVVTSILIKRALMNPVDFMFLSVNTVRINGTSFDTRTGNLFGPIGGEFGVLQSADILGMPVRLTSIVDPMPGGNVPQQIVASGAGAEDIKVRLFCRSDNQDMSLATILVAGWKKPADTISASYVPGN